MREPTLYYFAYGSNTDPERFRARVGEWRSRHKARLDDHRLRFADSVRSEGGGGAVVDADAGSRVYGVLFEITPEQLAAMDREEFDEKRDTTGRGVRVRRGVLTEGGPVEAELYTVEDDGGWCPPSEAYLGHILCGLEDAGHRPAVLDDVRAVAARAAKGSGAG